MIRRTAAQALLALFLPISLAGCSGSDDDGLAQPSAQTAQEPSAAEEPAPEACETRPPTVEPAAEISTDLSVAPEVPPSAAPPPCGLVISDVVVGTGPEATDGTTAAVKYVGAFYETGEEFDSSWSRGEDETLPFGICRQGVVPGFAVGPTGMKVGGRRRIVLPPQYGYGAEGSPPTIPANSTLVFVVDLVEVT